MTILYLTLWITSTIAVGTEQNSRMRLWWRLVTIITAGLWVVDSSGWSHVAAAAAWLVSVGTFVIDLRKVG